MVFYLKYRPKNIKELDSSYVRDRLSSVLKGPSISHAFLFTGPKGLGKTSTARIVAKAINCTGKKEGEVEPCNKCESCKSISGGSNLDVLEIDAASNRGIEEIRDLREKIRLSPVMSRKKIYIIDEVHMLTTEAFNALLKTLEEPPDHAVFILCTTEPHKVPGTIHSRCFQINFPKATTDDLLSSFSRIVKGEGIKADKEALIQIANLSDGSFRDGAKILEEMSMNDSAISVESLQKSYKTTTLENNIGDLTEVFENRDAKKGIDILQKLDSEGVDFKHLIEQLTKSLHEKLVEQIQGREGKLSIYELKELLEILTKAHSSIKFSVIPQLPLEMALVEWTSKKIEPNGSETGTVKTLRPSQGEHDKILSELIDRVKGNNFSLAGVLRSCKIEEIGRGEYHISTSYKFHKEMLSERKTLDLIEGILSEMKGQEIKVSVVLKE